MEIGCEMRNLETKGWSRIGRIRRGGFEILECWVRGFGELVGLGVKKRGAGAGAPEEPRLA